MSLSILRSCVRYGLGVVLLWGGMLGPSGCAKSKPLVEFPTLKALQRIAAQPVQRPAKSVGQVPSSGWQVDARRAARSSQEAWQPSTASERAFVGLLSAQNRPLRTPSALACAAHELGRFQLETGSEVPSALHSFVLGACGAVTPESARLSLSGTVTGNLSDDELWPRFAESIRTQLVAGLPATATDVGFWLGRSGDHVVASLVYAEQRHTLQPFSLVSADENRVTFAGRLQDHVDHVEGYINQGRFGVESCVVDPGVSPPQFRIVCPMAPSDRTAWVQLMYVRPGRVLGTLFLETLLRRGESEMPVYVESAGSRLSGDKIGFSQGVLAELNEVRRQAGLGPVTLADEQSATAGKLASHYFAGVTSRRSDTLLDDIVLGLLAGWQVPGMIRSGSFYSQYTARDLGPTAWLQAALALPAGRSTLLAPGVERVAVGQMAEAEGAGQGTLVTGYQLYHGNEHDQDAARLLSRINLARKDLGLGEASLVSGILPALREQLSRVHAGGRNPSAALDQVLQQAVDYSGQSMGGYVFETMSLDALQLPPEILRQPRLELAIGVTHRRPQGGAWAQYVIFVLYVQSAPPGV